MKFELFKIGMEILALLLLNLPLFWELWDDKKGDLTHDRDVVVRWIIATLSALIVWADGHIGFVIQHGFFQAGFLSLSFHFLIFDYAEAAQLKHKNWFEYLGKSSKEDQNKWWIHIGPKWRFIIKLIIFSIALILYFSS